MATVFSFIILLLLSIANAETNKTDTTSKASAKKENKIRKIIIDSDGGVNDAFALIWALDAFNNKLLSIQALTTVKTDLSPQNAFRNVIQMINITKRSTMRRKALAIPIGKPMENIEKDIPDISDDVSTDNNDDTQSVGDGLFGFSDIFSKYPDLITPKKKTDKAYETASFSDDLLIETILQNPNEISLIVTGPLTNLYSAELKHKDILSLCKDIYILGGEFRNKTGNSKTYALSEYNFNYDSNALYHLLNSVALPNVFIFPLDITRKLSFGLAHISLLYTLLNTDIQTEIEMCRMKMEKEADKFNSGEGFGEDDLFDSDRERDDGEFEDDFQCTQTGLMYIFYEKMMEETLRENYMNGESDSLLIEDASIIGYLLYPHLYDFKYVSCRVNGENGMVWFDTSLMVVEESGVSVPNCFVAMDVNSEKLIHAFTRDSVHMIHRMYLDYMDYMMNQMDW